MLQNIFKILPLIVLCLFAATSCDDDETKEESNYAFFIAGHTYGSPGANNEGVHPPFKENFDLIRDDNLVEFGFFTGDMVFIPTAEDWDEIDADVESLGMPVYFAAGNHDVTDRELYESRYGMTYYSFKENNDLFIVLDPNLDNWNISGDQLDFLIQTLEDNQDDTNNVFVFFHQLLWWESDNIYQNITLNSIQGRADEINFWTEIEPLFRAMPNEVYMFAGDVGANPTGDEFMYHNYNNITLVASGMGGGQRDNIIFIDVAKDKTVSFRLIALNGTDINALGLLEDYVL